MRILPSAQGKMTVEEDDKLENMKEIKEQKRHLNDPAY